MLHEVQKFYTCGIVVHMIQTSSMKIKMIKHIVDIIGDLINFI